MSVRFTLSGLILLLIASFSGAHLPRGRELWLSALFGVMVSGIGTGCLVYTEQWVPSGLASVFVTISPFWMIGLEAVIPGGARLHGPTIAGLLIGLVGTVVLVLPDAMREGLHGAFLHGFLTMQFGIIGWSLGSILQRRNPTKAHPVVSGAVQQLAAGLVFVPLALWTHPQPDAWTARSVWAMIYLVIFGSIVGYSSYVFALARLPVSIVSVYNYINPIIAVFLGWLFFRERIGPQEVLAMAIIFAGVAMVKRYSSKPPAPAPARVSEAS